MCNNDCDNCEEYCEYNDYDLNIYMSNFDWCSLANTYVDNEQCKIVGCENCRYYLDS